MAKDFVALLTAPESESFERKSGLDPTRPDEMLGLVADLTAMANTNGGGVLVGEPGKAIPEGHLPLFDSARVDDKVNSFVDPRVSGICSTTIDRDHVLIEIEKSQTPPHVFEREGNYHDLVGRQHLLFRRGEIVVRHSSKTERANRSDFDRWFEENRKRLFENVKMIFEARPGAQIRITEHEGVPVRIDPAAAGAQPVYDLLTPDPFRDLDQELMGGIKSWKTSGQYLNEKQILKAYSQRQEITDIEVLELLLRSSWEHRLPGYYWASRLAPSKLYTMLEEVIAGDRYPTTSEALRVASLLPRTWARVLLGHAETSSRASEKRLRRKLEAVVRARTRKHITLVQLLYPSATVKYKIAEGIKEVKAADLGAEIFEEILSTLPAEIKQNRTPFRQAELATYGVAIADASVEETPHAVPVDDPDAVPPQS